MKNCPNCSAPIDPYKTKCDYCGTRYFDLTAFDLSDHEPCYIKLKGNWMGQKGIITALVIPSLEFIEQNYDMAEATGRNGICYRTIANKTLDINVNFSCLVDTDKKSLMQIELEESNEQRN